MGSATRALRRSTGALAVERARALGGAGGKRCTALDGRQGYVLTAKPVGGTFEVLVGGKRERWGREQISVEELCRLMDIEVRSE